MHPSGTSQSPRHTSAHASSAATTSSAHGVPAGGQAERMTTVETPGGLVYTEFGESLADEGSTGDQTGRGISADSDPVYSEDDFKTTAEPQATFFDATED